ncbi:GreA/GreB family elongation factor [Acidovorax sp. Leaf160]|uniref:GreA/GreB family elongation factor n=1 Tax=Acidovorax sp. Leaf160 TaxID=1736280 RepID=UPI0006F690F6|nr:GreA/GreB family elongation factor [Acidovorax sp. Leaf160]KQR50431.1 transcription elongation factor GreAB [Acidovorax sp. Leaf160]
MQVPAIHGERVLTDLDFARLSKLIDPQDETLLAEVLAAADVTGSRAVQADVVTMNSQMEVADITTGRTQVLTLCYPRDAAPAAGLISVLSPVGTALLGLKSGDRAVWHTPDGQVCEAAVTRICHQPEASGDFLS